MFNTKKSKLQFIISLKKLDCY